MKEVKNILNAPGNMAFVDADVNRAVRQQLHLKYPS